MAKNWVLDTSADEETVVQAFRDVFFARPSVTERLKVWSKAAQLRSNLAWEQSIADGAVIAARLVSGGLREAIASSQRGGGSGIGTTIAMSVASCEGGTTAQFWLANFNTFMGLNQQGDVLKSFTKQVASRLSDEGERASTHR